MNYGCQIKRDLGKQIGMLRLQRGQTMHEVARATNIPLDILDRLETGMNIGWKKYKILFDYYNCEIFIASKT